MARWLIRHRVALLIVIGFATIAFGAVGTGIRFDFSPQAIYAGDGELLERSEALKDVFGHTDAILLVVLEATAGADVLAPDALTWTARFVRAVEGLARIDGAEALSTLRLPRPPPDVALGPRMGDPLVGRDPADAGTTEAARVLLRRVPLLEETFVSRDRRAAAVLVYLEPEARRVEAMRSVIEEIEARIERAPAPSGYRVRLSGLPAIRTDVVRSLELEQVRRMPLAILVVVLVLVLVLRRVSGTLLPLLAVGAGMLWTAGAFTLAGQSLNLISNILPVFLFTIGMANAVHVVNRYAEECQRHPGDRHTAATRTIAHMGPACLLTYLTTAIGFLSLTTARSQVLREVGIQTGVGLALLYLSTMLVLGCLLSRCRPPHRPGVGETSGPSIARAATATGRAVANHPRLVLWAALALIGASLVGALRLGVDCRATETYDADHAMTRSLRLVEQKLGGVLTLDVDLRGGAPRAFLDPAAHRRVAAFARFAAAQPDVLRARSFVDYHEEVLRRMHAGGGDESVPTLPADDEVARLQLQASHLACTLAGGALHYDGFLTEDASRARVLLRVPDVGSRRLRALFDVLEAKLDALFPAGDGIEAHLTGDAYVFARAMDGFIRDILLSLLGAAVVIFGVIALLFRSLRYGLISMLPNLTPLVLTAGYMRLRGYDLDASNVIVFAISLGVAVDNTIHFLARFREESRAGGAVPAAIERTLQGAGPAIVLTSVLLVLGLATLHVSAFVPTQRFAELTSVTMVAALIGDLCLLPACLVILGRRRMPRAEPR